MGTQVFVLLHAPVSQLWAYDTATNQWSGLSTPPSIAFQSPFFVVQPKVVMVSGTKTWVYDVIADVWTARADAPGDMRAAVGFAVGSRGYLAGGFYNTPLTWEYDLAADQWMGRASQHLGVGTADIEGVSFTLGDRAYVTGTNLGFWQYTPALDQWAARSYVSGAYACAFAAGGRGYVFTHAGLQEYDGAADAWLSADNYAGTAQCYAGCAAVGADGYVGLGNVFSSNTCTLDHVNEFWKVTPAP